MKTMYKIITLALVLIFIAGCGGGGGGSSSGTSTSGYTTVKMKVSSVNTASTNSNATIKSSPIPQNVTHIRFKMNDNNLIPFVWPPIPTTQGTDQWFIDIVPNGKKHFKADALDAQGNVLFSGSVFIELNGGIVFIIFDMFPANPTPPETPNTPPVFRGITGISNVTTNSMTLSWDSATDDKTPPERIQYLIYMSTTPGGEDFSFPAYFTDPNTNPGATSFNVTGLSPNTTYYFVVRAFDGLLSDENTIEMSATTLRGPDTTAPTFDGITAARPQSRTAIRLFWNPATDDVTSSANMRYLVYMATRAGGENFTSPNYTLTGVTNYIVDGLQAGENRCFIVRAQDEAGNIDQNTVERCATAMTGLYVDVNTGSDTTGTGSQARPFKTITKALSVTAGNERITVAYGNYNVASGEVFPLNLKTGTSLWTLPAGEVEETNIDNSAAGIIGNTIVGASGSSITNFNIRTGSNHAVNDNNASITIDSCYIQGTGGGKITNIGVALGSSGSRVLNSSISGYSTGVYVNAGSTIQNNEITFNDPNGIRVVGGNPDITNNTIAYNSRGIELDSNVTRPITGNEIYCNDPVDLLINDTVTNTTDARNNAWDHNPPTIVGDFTDCSAGTDICYEIAPAPLYTPSTLAIVQCGP